MRANTDWQHLKKENEKSKHTHPRGAHTSHTYTSHIHTLHTQSLHTYLVHVLQSLGWHFDTFTLSGVGAGGVGGVWYDSAGEGTQCPQYDATHLWHSFFPMPLLVCVCDVRKREGKRGWKGRTRWDEMEERGEFFSEDNTTMYIPYKYTLSYHIHSYIRSSHRVHHTHELLSNHMTYITHTSTHHVHHTHINTSRTSTCKTSHMYITHTHT